LNNSLIQTLQKLIEQKGKPIAGYKLANLLGPIIQVNTLEKNICYLRKEFGNAFIWSEAKEGKNYVSYWCEPNLATENNNFEKIGSETRAELNRMLSDAQKHPIGHLVVANHLEPEKRAKKGVSVSLNSIVADKINEYEKIMWEYPVNHNQRAEIQAQIERLQCKKQK